MIEDSASGPSKPALMGVDGRMDRTPVTICHVRMIGGM